MQWQVSYQNNGKTIIKLYANMNTATLAVEKLAKKGIVASYSPTGEK